MFNPKKAGPCLRRVLSYGSLSSRDKFLLKAGSSGLVHRLISAAFTFIPTALLTRAFGSEIFGVWVALSILPQWLSLSDSGIGSSLTVKLSAHFSRNDWSAARTLVWSAFWTQSIIAVAAMAVLVTALKIFGIGALFKALPVDEHTATISAILLGCTTVACLPLRHYSIVLNSYQRPIDNAMIGLIMPALSALGSLVVYFKGLDLLQYTIIFCAANFVQCLAGCAWTLLVRFRQLWKPLCFNWPVGWDLTRTGFIFFLGGLTWIINSTADSVLLSRMVGTSATTDYNLCFRLFSFISMATAILGSGLTPAYAEARAKREWGWIKARFRHSLSISAAIGLSTSLVTALLAPWVIDIWSGGTSKPGWGMILNFAFWFMIFPLNQAVAFVLSGLERPKEMLKIGIGTMLLNIPLSYILIMKFGAAGAVAGSAIAILIAGILYPMAIIGKIFKESDIPPPLESDRTESKITSTLAP